MRIATLVVAVLLATVIAASAQTPFIGVYFDSGYNYMAKEDGVCPGVGTLETWYVVGQNFNTFVAGMEFKIEYPGVVMWLSDAGTPPVTIGNTSTGISMGFGLPINGFFPVSICQVNVMWMCEGGCPSQNIPVRVVQHPATGYLGGTDFPNFNLVPAVGMTSLICPSVPVQDTTWGQVKALYE